MKDKKSGVILIGHGGLPSDIPKEVVEDFMKIHKQRVRAGTPITSKEKELDNVIRFWTRSPETDPYKYGLEKLAEQLAPRLKDYILITAYNEFCYPSIEQAADVLVEKDITEVILVTTMITPGGSHSEREIPEEVEALRLKYPNVNYEYAWPYDLGIFSDLLADHIHSFNKTPSA